MTSTITHVRDTLAARRAQRSERTRIERELAAYTSAADRAELGAIISRHTAEETSLLQAILDRRVA
jgi:hypothetical protein